MGTNPRFSFGSSDGTVVYTSVLSPFPMVVPEATINALRRYAVAISKRKALSEASPT